MFTKTQWTMMAAGAIVIGGLAGCQNFLARSGLGSATFDVPCGNKLETTIWKETTLWMQYRPFRAGEVPETHKFVAKSPLGVLEGDVTLKESICK
jgi:hypothetical protein